MEQLFRFPVPKSVVDSLVAGAHLQNQLTVAQLAEDALHKLGLDAESAGIDVEVAEHRLVESDTASEAEDAEVDLWECTHSWFDRAVRLFPELSEDARIERLEALSNEHDFEADEAIYYSMMVACIAQLSDDRVAQVLSDLGAQDGVGSQVTLEDVRKWSGRQADYGGIIRGAWVNNLFQSGLESVPASVTEERTRDAIARMGVSGFSPTYAAAAAWLADRVVRIMPTRVENALAFLRILAEHEIAVAPAGALPTELMHLRAHGPTTTWSTAIRIHEATLAMSSAIDSARQLLAGAASASPTGYPAHGRRRSAGI
jgi:hypothetical protein